MIIKFLLVIGVIAIVYFLFMKQKTVAQSTDKDADDKKSKNETKSNEMVECSKCGIYSEISTTILSNNKYYCSQECLEKI